jgi:hypothetical protein
MQILQDLCECPRFWWPLPLFASTFWTLRGCGLSTFLNSVLQILQDFCEFPISGGPRLSSHPHSRLCRAAVYLHFRLSLHPHSGLCSAEVYLYFWTLQEFGLQYVHVSTLIFRFSIYISELCFADFARSLRVPSFLVAPASLRIYRNSTLRYASQ